MRKWWHRSTLAALVLYLSVPAHAAGGVTAIVHDAGSVRAWVEVRVVAEARKENRITVRIAGSEIRITDALEPLSAGAGCFQASSNTVACESVGSGVVKIDARVRDDFVPVRADLRTELNGGSGA